VRGVKTLGLLSKPTAQRFTLGLLSKPTAQRFGGTGLGLAMTHKLARMMGGDE
jgi:signal transduction histidine kinase